MAQFPSLKAKQLLRVLQAEPLGYRITRQKGSHRKLEAVSHPTVIFAFHDGQTIRPSTVRTSFATRSGSPIGMPERYSEDVMTVRVLYRQDADTWVASSPDVPRWMAVADTYAEANRLAEEGVRFALDCRDVAIEHYVPAGVAVAA
ncbi:MAG TPA: type II toxin-antitoxin system HicA family toxin [Solirubrobacteraceae bacterium]|nr:type II toxin-antitoxin system HicA family toxin [Solirubrobacteraceae bacterium]